jgi:hypothetical protein
VEFNLLTTRCWTGELRVSIDSRTRPFKGYQVKGERQFGSTMGAGREGKAAYQAAALQCIIQSSRPSMRSWNLLGIISGAMANPDKVVEVR